MKKLAIALIVFGSAASAAHAGTAVTHDQAKRIQAALNALDCYGGEMEAERGGAVFEVDDAVCKDGEYDFKLDKNFKVLSQTR